MRKARTYLIVFAALLAGFAMGHLASVNLANGSSQCSVYSPRDPHVKAVVQWGKTT